MVENLERCGPWFPKVLAVTPTHNTTNMGMIAQLLIAHATQTHALPRPEAYTRFLPELKPIFKTPTFQGALEILLAVDDLTALILPVSDGFLGTEAPLPDRSRHFFEAVRAYRDLREKEGCYVPLILVGRYHSVEQGGRFDSHQAFFEAANLAGADVLIPDIPYARVGISTVLSQSAAVFKDPVCYRTEPRIVVVGYRSQERSVQLPFYRGVGDRIVTFRQQGILFLPFHGYLATQALLRPYDSTPQLVQAFARGGVQS